MDEEWVENQIFLLCFADSCDSVPSEIELPFEIKPDDFLRAAQQHLVDSRRGPVHLVDALTDAKRALDCRLQELFFVFGLSGRATHWSMPQKLGVLAYLSLPAPKILRKVNVFRNVAEHEFRPPSADVVADFVDAVELFLESTSWYIKSFADEARFTTSAECDWMYWRVSLDREVDQLTLRGYRVEDGGEEGAATIGPKHHLYLPLLRVYIAALFDRLLALQWTPDLPDGV